MFFLPQSSIQPRSDFPEPPSRSDPVPLTAIPANLSFVTGAGPGGIVVGGGATTTANGTITSAGPNNAAGVPITGIFSLTRTICGSAMECTRSAWASGFNGFRTTRTPLHAKLGQATFASLTTFFRDRSAILHFKSCPSTRNWGGGAFSARGISKIPSRCGAI